MLPPLACISHSVLNLSVETLCVAYLGRIDPFIHSPNISVFGMYQLITIPSPARIEQALNFFRDRHFRFDNERIRLQR
jgi:hypothetical protein